MAKSKTSTSNDNGADTDVLEQPVPEIKPTKSDKVNSTWAMGELPSDTKEVIPAEEVVGVKKKPAVPEKDDEQQLEDSAGKDKPKPESEPDIVPELTPSSILEAMTAGEDNDFTLDEPEKKGETEGKEGEPKPKEKITDTDIISRIAKEIGINDAQTPEQLISSIKETISTAKAGAGAPVAGLDRVLALNNRDLYKTYLMRNHNFSDERAEKYIADRVEMHGEEWVDMEAEPVRLQVETLREKVMNDHASREMAKEKESAKFAATARNTVKEMKTIFGKIPLKQHVAKLKEFQAQISTDEGFNAMRNDSKKLTEAMFVLNFGGDILEKFLEEKLSENGIETWKKFYKSEIADKILNRSKAREQTEYPNKGVKPSSFAKGGWD